MASALPACATRSATSRAGEFSCFLELPVKAENIVETNQPTNPLANYRPLPKIKSISHFNPAVTISLLISGNCGVVQAVANICAQLLGATTAAGFLYGIVPRGINSNLGSNVIAPDFSAGAALGAEIFFTALLVFVVHSTACTTSNNVAPMAPLAIGLSVFLAHAVMLVSCAFGLPVEAENLATNQLTNYRPLPQKAHRRVLDQPRALLRPRARLQHVGRLLGEFSSIFDRPVESESIPETN